MTAPANRYSSAFGHFLTIDAGEAFLAEFTPPSGPVLEPPHDSDTGKILRTLRCSLAGRARFGHTCLA